MPVFLDSNTPAGSEHPLKAPCVRLLELEKRPQLSPRDALHAATALDNGIAAIVSAGPDLGWVEGITRMDPAAV